MTQTPITHIERIEIKGLWGKYDIDWTLDPKVNILIGINGSGKTTVLNLVYSLFNNTGKIDEIIGLNNEYRLFKVYAYMNNNDFVGRENTLEVSNINRGKARRYFKNLEKIATFETELIDKETLDKVRKVTDFKVVSNLDLEFVKLIDQFKSYLIFLKNKEDEEDKRFKSKISDFIKRNSKENNGTAELEQFYLENEALIKKLNEEKNLFTSIVNQLFSQTEKIIDYNTSNALIFRDLKTDNTYRIDQLSSGEKQMLIILLKVLLQDNQPYILLLDEPEISMHMSWQVDLIDNIQKLNENCQLIIATHSPSIIQKGWGSKVFLMKENEEDTRGILHKINQEVAA